MANPSTSPAVQVAAPPCKKPTNLSEALVLHPEAFSWPLEGHTKVSSTKPPPANLSPDMFVVEAGSQNLAVAPALLPEWLSWPVDLLSKVNGPLHKPATPVVPPAVDVAIFGQSPPLPGVSCKSSEEGEVLVFDDATTDRLAAPFKWALIGKFSQQVPSSRITSKFFSELKLSGEVGLKWLNKRQVLILLHNECDFVNVWVKRFFQINGCPMRVFKWTPTFRLNQECPIVPIWVSLPDLPVHLYEKQSLFLIASKLGIPLKVDEATAYKNRLSCARFCVGLNLLKPIQNSVSLVINGVKWAQSVVYDKVPDYCSVCLHVGHGSENCLVRAKSNRYSGNGDGLVGAGVSGPTLSSGPSVVKAVSVINGKKKRKNKKRKARNRADKKSVISGFVPSCSGHMHGDMQGEEDEDVAGVGVSGLSRVGASLVGLAVPPGGKIALADSPSVDGDVTSALLVSRVGLIGAFNVPVGVNASEATRGASVDLAINDPTTLSCGSADFPRECISSALTVELPAVKHLIAEDSNSNATVRGDVSAGAGFKGWELLGHTRGIIGPGPLNTSFFAGPIKLANGPPGLFKAAGPGPAKTKRKALALTRRVRHKLKMKKLKKLLDDDIWLLVGVDKARIENRQKIKLDGHPDNSMVVPVLKEWESPYEDAIPLQTLFPDDCKYGLPELNDNSIYDSDYGDDLHEFCYDGILGLI